MEILKQNYQSKFIDLENLPDAITWVNFSNYKRFTFLKLFNQVNDFGARYHKAQKSSNTGNDYK